jgi:CBS domain-containing protein
VKVTAIMSREVVTVTPETGVKVAARILADRGLSALPVVDAKGTLMGIVSEADLLAIETRPDSRLQATPQAPSAGTTPKSVADVMTRDVLVVKEDSEVSQAARIMLEAGVKRLPVVRGRRVVGIVSRRDLIRVIARRDDGIEAELARRLGELGLGAAPGSFSVADGVATIEIDDHGSGRRLAESVALSVPGVLEVRFLAPRSDGKSGARLRKSPGRKAR